MASAAKKCTACGHESTDPEWCDQCGSDLGGPDVALLLSAGLRVSMPLRAPFGSLRSSDMLRSGQLPRYETGPLAKVDTKVLTPVSVRGRERERERDREHENTGRFSTLDPVEFAALDDPIEVEELDQDVVVVTLSEVVRRFDGTEDWLAHSDRGETFIVAASRAPGPPLDSLPEHLATIVDWPLSECEVDGVYLRLHRAKSGETLEQRVRDYDERVPVAEFLLWFETIANALEQVHRAGFVLLSLSPQTISFERVGGVRFLNIRNPVPVGATISAHRETVPGIPGFLAPEVLLDDGSLTASSAADIFSLAAVAWFVLARRTPPVSALTSYLPAMRARDLAPDAPLHIEPMLWTALTPDVELRPGSPAELMAGLRAALEPALRRDRTAPHAPDLAIAVETHIGISKREYYPLNQDAAFVAISQDRLTTLICVADGVSTSEYGRGEEASAFVAGRARALWEQLPQVAERRDDIAWAAWIDSIIQRANSDLINVVNQRHGPFDHDPNGVMGSTCVIAVIHRGVAYMASVGDSHAYIVNGDYIERVNREHNIATLAVAEGYSPDDAFGSVHAAALGRCVGTFDFGPGGALIPARVETDSYRFRMLLGDRLVICSDGVTDYIAHTPDAAMHVIRSVICSENIPALACLEFIMLANRNGGGDNITAAVCYVGNIDGGQVLSAQVVGS